MRVETDVLVCGGGCAGLAAALASARNGAKTLLVERAGFAGGIITAVGLPYFDGIAHVKDNRVVVGGMGVQLVLGWKIRLTKIMQSESRHAISVPLPLPLPVPGLVSHRARAWARARARAR